MKHEQALKELKERMQEIAGAWNGEETTFMFEGTLFQEEDAHKAKEIVDHIKKIEELLLFIEEN